MKDDKIRHGEIKYESLWAFILKFVKMPLRASIFTALNNGG